MRKLPKILNGYAENPKDSDTETEKKKTSNGKQKKSDLKIRRQCICKSHQPLSIMHTRRIV